MRDAIAFETDVSKIDWHCQQKKQFELAEFAGGFLHDLGTRLRGVYLDPPFYFGESGPEQQTEGTCTRNAYNAHLPACSGMPLFIFPTVPHLRRGKTVVSIIRSIIGR